MIKFFLLAIGLLGSALAGMIAVAGRRKKKIKALQGEVESARRELRRLGEFYTAKEEIKNDADEKKKTIHSGDPCADFDNSLELLHNAAGSGGGKKTPGS